MLPRNKVERANSVYDLPSIEQAINWMHAALGYPVASTWLKVYQAGNFVGFTFADVKYIRKYYPETDKTPAGHLIRQRQNMRFTKPKPVLFKTINTTELQGNRKQHVYIKVIETRETIYSYQTGAFSVQSKKNHKYIMLIVEISL